MLYLNNVRNKSVCHMFVTQNSHLLLSVIRVMELLCGRNITKFPNKFDTFILCNKYFSMRNKS